MTDSSKNSNSVRLDALDGLRGLAILLVVLNHLRWGPLFEILPLALRPLLGSLVGGGKTGVLILFLLSGFLMARLYPKFTDKAAKISFWQKRYLRIFPAFGAMCTALFLVRWWWEVLPPAAILGVVVLVIVGMGMVWQKILSQTNAGEIEKKSIQFFWLVQALAAVGYVFLQWWVPAAVFYQIWPRALQNIVSFLANLTMTLPLGVYAPQLDGVYWSVMAEVFFYLLYPSIVLPLVEKVAAQTNAGLKWAHFALLFPFFYGLALVFKTVLGLGMLEIYMAMFFVTGVVVGKAYETAIWRQTQIRLQNLPAWLTVLLGLAGVWGLSLLQNFFAWYATGVTLLWVFPLVLVFCLTLTARTGWAKIMNWSGLKMLGKVSYALYLTHTIAIEVWVKNGAPTSIGQMILLLVASVIVMAGLTVLVHYFLEMPYFNRPKAVKTLSTPAVKTPFPSTPERTANLALGGLAVMCLVLVWIGYRVPVSLATRVKNYTDSSVPAVAVLTTQPLEMQFQSKSDNLGMVLIHLESLSDSQVAAAGLTRGSFSEGALKVVLRDEQGVEVSNTNYPLYQLFNARFHPVGIPLIADSLGKNYQLSLSLTNDETTQKIALIQDGLAFRTVSVYGKKDLLKNPLLLVTILGEKAIQPFTEQPAQQALALLSPLVLGLGILKTRKA